MTEKKHPSGLSVLFSTEMFERISFYSMRAIFVLYMTKALMFDKAHASWVYGNYIGLVYITAILGGYLSDKYLGNRKSVVTGGFMMAFGQFLLFLSASFYSTSSAVPFMYGGLLLLAFGNGFLKPNISVMVGDLYQKNDKRIESAFTIFYMGINIGALLGPIISGYVGETDDPGDFKWGFLVACLGMIIGMMIFLSLKNKHLNTPDGTEIGMKPEIQTDHKQQPLTKIEKQRITAIGIMCLFVVFFWSAFEQSGVSLTFMADELIDRTILGFTIPASQFQIINPLCIIIFAPLFAILWQKLGTLNPSIPTKMAIGLFLVGIGFLIIAQASIGASSTNKINFIWLILMYSFHTFGELSISPVGLSMVKKLSPVRLTSFLMGIWFLTAGIANKTAGIIAALYPDGEPQTLFGFPIKTVYDFNMIFVFMTFGASALLLLMSKRINQLMHIDTFEAKDTITVQKEEIDAVA